MIKWKFIFIRLSLLAILLLTIHFGSAPIVSLVVRTTVQMLTGSKLEIDTFNASPFQTRLSTGHVRLGHPEKDLENLVDFDQSEIKLDQAALLRKKFIVTAGVVEGLEFGTGRLDSGILPENTEEASQPSNNYLTRMGKQAGQRLGSLLNQRFEENFESVHCAREILDRWPAEYDQLIARGKKLEDRIQNIRELAKNIQENPLNTLRDLPRIEASLQDGLRIRDEIDALRRRLIDYREQIVKDRENLLGAKKRDLARVEELKTDKRLNGKSMSQLLIGETQGRRVDQAIAWIKWLRQTFPHPKNSLQASRGRGQTIRFAGQIDQPDLLVRSLKINGHGTMEDKPYTFTGTLGGITSQPEIYGKPAYLQLEAVGNIQFTLKAMIDRSQKMDHDRLTIQVPEMRVASQKMKIDEKNRLTLDRSTLEIIARVELKGDRLGGHIKAMQRDFDLQLESKSKNAFAHELTNMLNEDLKSIRQFEVVAKLSGTLAEPEWHLQSDLGPQLSQAVQTTLVRGYEKKKTELIARLDIKTEKSLQAFAKLVEQQEEKILAVLAKHSEELIRLQTRVSSLIRPGGLRFR